MSGRAIKKLKAEDAEALFDSPYLVLAAKSNIAVIQFLTKTIKVIEKAVKFQRGNGVKSALDSPLNALSISRSVF
jgi:hypothetical protein